MTGDTIKILIDKGYYFNNNGLMLLKKKAGEFPYIVECGSLLKNQPRVKSDGSFSKFDLALDYFNELEIFFKLRKNNRIKKRKSSNKLSIDIRWMSELDDLTPPKKGSAQFLNFKVCEAVSSIMYEMKRMLKGKTIKILDTSISVLHEPERNVHESNEMIENEDGTFDLVGTGKIIGKEKAKAGVFVSVLTEDMEGKN